MAKDPELPDIRKDLDLYLKQVLKAYKIPGLAVSWLDANQTHILRQVGIRKMGKPDELVIEDRFHIGSNTKAMTAHLAGLMVADGRLAWDTTIGSTFPDLKKKIHPKYQAVNLAQLLRHTSGLPGYTQRNELPKVRRDDPREQRLDFLLYALRNAPFYEPGSKNFYSNGGYSIAAAMMEQVMDISWETAMQNRIFLPMGIKAGFGWPAYGDAKQPWGHHQILWMTRPHNPLDQYQLPELLDPAGGVNISIADYTGYIQTHIRGLQNIPNPILPASVAAELHRAENGFAMGWGVQKLVNGLEVHSHAGSAGTFFTMAAILPEKGQAGIVFCNAGTASAVRGCQAVMRAMVDAFAQSS